MNHVETLLNIGTVIARACVEVWEDDLASPNKVNFKANPVQGNCEVAPTVSLRLRASKHKTSSETGMRVKSKYNVNIRYGCHKILISARTISSQTHRLKVGL